MTIRYKYRIAIIIFLLESIMMFLVLGKTLTYIKVSNLHIQESNEKMIVALLSDISKTALFTEEFDQLQHHVEEVGENSRVKQIIVADNLSTVVSSTDFSKVGQKIPALHNTSSRFWVKESISDLGVVAILFSNEELLASNTNATQLGGSIALSGMLIIAIAGLLGGHFLTRRLKKLSVTTRKFAEGDYSARTEMTGSDELNQVGAAFDTMALKIETNIHALEEKVAERTKELTTLNAELLKLSENDGLTGIANRRVFDRELARELKKFKRTNASLTLLMLDIDFFKRYNDAYGHFSGDRCLQQVAKAISNAVKREGTDLVARYGGEEFAVILSDTDQNGGLAVAKGIREGVKELAITHCNSAAAPIVTISIGVGSLEENKIISARELIIKADQALYRAKNAGRDRVSL